MSEMKASILGLKPKVFPVEIAKEELDLVVYVRVMRGSERFIMEKIAIDKESENNGLVEIAYLCVCDEDGKRLWPQRKPSEKAEIKADKEEIEELPADFLYMVYNKAMFVNGLADTDPSDRVKGSEPTVDSTSTTSSPSD